MAFEPKVTILRKFTSHISYLPNTIQLQNVRRFDFDSTWTHRNWNILKRNKFGWLPFNENIKLFIWSAVKLTFAQIRQLMPWLTCKNCKTKFFTPKNWKLKSFKFDCIQKSLILCLDNKLYSGCSTIGPTMSSLSAMPHASVICYADHSLVPQ